MWERVLLDLEAQFDDAAHRDLDAQVVDRTRSLVSATEWVDRLRATTGEVVSLRLLGGVVLEGTVRVVGLDWILLGPTTGQGGQIEEVIVRAGAVVAVRGTTHAVATADGLRGSRRRSTLGIVCRRLARQRSNVTLTCVDGTLVRGVLDRVGADYLEVVASRDRAGVDPRGPREVVPLQMVVAVGRAD